jgi:hypothetical protein
MYHRSARTKASHNTITVVECDRPIAPERLRRALDRLLDCCPWPASRLRRGFPWGALHWAAGPREALVPPPVRHRSVSSPAELHDALEAELNAPIDPRREAPLRFLLVDGWPEETGRHGFLVVTWFHSLMDPRGAENLVRHLVELDDAGDVRQADHESPPFTGAQDPRPLLERARLGRQNLEYMRALMTTPPVSLGSQRTTSGRSRFWQGTFVEQDPIVNGKRAARDICWRLALVGKALTALWEKRRLPDVPYVVPISIDLRPKGDAGPVIGARLAFHFARFAPSETADVVGLSKSLRRHMTDAIREGHLDTNAAGMEFLKYRPLWMMARALPGGPHAEMCSFNCADTMDFAVAPDTIFGARLVNGYHAAAVLPRPGVGVFFNRCGAASNLVVSWIDGVVDEDDVAQIVDVVREGMGWAKHP